MRSRSLPWILFGLALAMAVVFGVLWQRANADDRTRADVAAAATRFLAALTNFQSTTIDADVRVIKGYAVADFSDQLKSFFDQQSIDAIKKAKAKSVGRVQSVFVESLSGGSASVFAVVNEAVTNASSTTPRTEVLRFEVTLIDTKSGWKVSRVDILQSPGPSPLAP
jgi:hypothetical protein